MYEGVSTTTLLRQRFQPENPGQPVLNLTYPGCSDPLFILQTPNGPEGPSNLCFIAFRMLTKELDDIINVFQSCLTKEHHSTRAPRNFDATLDQRERVPRAFLQAGDREWFLYQLVTLEHIPIAEKLDELPDDELLLVVAQVGNIHEHPTIIALRRHVLEASYRAGDRQSA